VYIARRFPAAPRSVPRERVLFARHSYNNPVKYSDPSGHSVCLSIDCEPPSFIGSIPPPGRQPAGLHYSGVQTDTNGNGIPDVPDPTWAIPPMRGVCSYNDLTECLYSGGFWPSGTLWVTDEEWDELKLALFYDINERIGEESVWTPDLKPENMSWPFFPFHSEDYHHRMIYDTPFWNGTHGQFEGDVCFETGACYAREDVNYIAQGMWSAAANEGILGGLVIANAWKLVEYQHFANSGSQYWTVQGVLTYEYLSILGPSQ
jgi:hypothetical protein